MGILGVQTIAHVSDRAVAQGNRFGRRGSNSKAWNPFALSLGWHDFPIDPIARMPLQHPYVPGEPVNPKTLSP